MRMIDLLSNRVSRIQWSPIEEVSFLMSGRRDVINLASGLPDPRYMPVDLMSELMCEVYEKYGREVLSYPEAYGLDVLREEIKRFLERHEVNTKGRDVIITCGAQHAVSAIARAFLEDNDKYAVENPTFVETLIALKYYSENCIPVSVNSSGLDVRELEKVSREGIKALYVIPNAQNPTGISYSDDVRREIARISEEVGFVIIEDDPYGPIVSERPNPIANATKNTIYVGSFSKILAPGLRVGFMLVPEEVLDAIGMTMQLDFATHPPSMYVLYEALRRGIVDSVLRNVRRVYREKTKLVLSVLEDTMPEGVEWTRPRTSFHFMIFTNGINAREILEEAYRRGVVFVPGDLFYVRSPRHDSLRISISYPTEKEIETGVKILADVIKSQA